MVITSGWLLLLLRGQAPELPEALDDFGRLPPPGEATDDFPRRGEAMFQRGHGLGPSLSLVISWWFHDDRLHVWNIDLQNSVMFGQILLHIPCMERMGKTIFMMRYPEFLCIKDSKKKKLDMYICIYICHFMILWWWHFWWYLWESRLCDFMIPIYGVSVWIYASFMIAFATIQELHNLWEPNPDFLVAVC